MTNPPRRKPILRKEVVETITWGEVVVRQFLGTDRMEISAVYTPTGDSSLAGETAQQERARQRVEYNCMINAVLAKAVLQQGTDDPLYSPEEWNAWQVQTGNNDADGMQIQVDLLKVTQKALGMNGYRLLPVGDEPGEDVAKNA